MGGGAINVITAEQGFPSFQRCFVKQLAAKSAAFIAHRKEHLQETERLVSLFQFPNRVRIMSPLLPAYAALAAAIAFEVTGSSLLQKSQQFSKLMPTIGLALCFAASLYFLSIALKTIPLGVAYAIWGGLGIVLTAIVSVVVFRMTLDFAAIAGIGLIVSGVLVMNLLSHSVAH